MEGLAYVTAEHGPAEEAALLLGAADTLWQRLGSPLTRFGHFRHLRTLCESTIRDALGEEAFAEARTAGSRWSAERAVAYAIGTAGSAPGVGSARRRVPDRLAQLTPRECEVARLVAKGLTNRAIAKTLVIAERTVDGHVQHILVKLGFTSRTAAAAWVLERDRELVVLRRQPRPALPLGTTDRHRSRYRPGRGAGRPPTC